MNSQNKLPTAEYQGRFFEVGFNAGILAYLGQHSLSQSWVDFYSPYLEKLVFSKMVKRVIEETKSISPVNEKIVAEWCQLILLRGFLGGLSFINEYLETKTRKGFNKVELLYYQCDFTGENSINTNNVDKDTVLKSILEQFRDIVKNLDKDSINRDIKEYQNKGEFLKADTLMLWRFKEEYSLLVVDTSLFAQQTNEELANLEFVEKIRKNLIRELNYIRSKSIFTRLNIDTGETNLNYAFAPGLADYFKAFQTQNENKESLKLIQAASYAYSFYNFLQKRKVIDQSKIVSITAIGYSDRLSSSMTVKPENIEIMKTCYDIYRHKNEYISEETQEVRAKIFRLIKQKIYKSFDNGRQFVDKLLCASPRESISITHTEKLPDFANTTTLRDAHAKLIQENLQSDVNYLFLTGNPGIGKTTAIAEFLKKNIDEGFLFLYISPRIQVNKDIIEKFKNKNTQKLVDDRLFCLTSDGKITQEKTHNAKYIVKYQSEEYPEDFFIQKSVRFINLNNQSPSQYSNPRTLEKKDDETIQSKPSSTPGVLASLSQAIYTLIDGQISNQIIATASVQANTTTRNGQTTNHLDIIFQSAYQSSNNRVIPSKLKEISSRIKHLFIMIDEITGSETGVDFLHGIGKFCKKYDLFNPQHGFNTKIIVADASIVEIDVINQHLKNTESEPDKIFFRQTNKPPQALTKEEFKFTNQSAVIINSNSYPAKTLDITYKVSIESQEFQPDNSKLQKEENTLAKDLEKTILKDIKSRWEQPGQILLYIQSKPKLRTILEKLSKSLPQELIKNVDYLEVRSNLNEQEKQQVHEHKEDENIKLICMTSAGSRGLSFPYVKHILVEIPCFQLEQNLMEIIQVIYRGRGDEEIDKQDKQIIFYFAEKAIYYRDDDPDLSRQETILNILNTILILKLSMLTRIKGAGKLGEDKDKFLLIPIGGKSTTAAGENFSSKINNLLELLHQEYRMNPENTILKKIKDDLQKLLSRTEFSLKNDPEFSQLSYLAARQNFADKFSQAINNNFADLLQFGNLEDSYIVGGLIIVPIKDKSLAKKYKLKLAEIIRVNSAHLLQILEAMKLGDEYHENLRYATREAINLIREIQTETEKSQNLLEDSKYADQYYAFPLFTLLNISNLSEYLEQEEEDSSFKKILTYYLKSLYPIYDILPIGYQYQEFPFLLFRSYSLQQLRQQLFTKNYLFNSSELNIVNMILSKEENPVSVWGISP